MLQLSAEGKPPDEMIGALILLVSERYPDWDQSEPWRIAMAVQSFLRR